MLLLIQILEKEVIIMKNKLVISTLIIAAALSTTMAIAPVTASAKTNQNEIVQVASYNVGYVSGDEVRVRSESNTGSSSKVYGYLYKKNVVTVVSLKTINGFYQILNPFGSGYAYISAQYVYFGSID
jgi:uncharacterized protein YgiM (DUF1202 family)